MTILKEIDGIAVSVTAPKRAKVTQAELKAYVERGRAKCGKMLKGINLTITGDEVFLDYVMQGKPFERIRRITGYLVGTTDRFNDAKRAEEHDRVKHGTEAEDE